MSVYTKPSQMYQYKGDVTSLEASKSGDLDIILREIVRKREGSSDDTSMSDRLLLGAPKLFWSDLFFRAFSPLSATASDGSQFADDILIFVSRTQDSNPKRDLRVLRRASPHLPSPGSADVDWEETMYLNLLMQCFVYILTVAVCTRTGPQELQILRKFCHTVYPSPNHRRMDRKNSSQESAYPNLIFSVDSYEDVFADCVVHDTECVCMELTALDLSGHSYGVCFRGLLQYDALKKAYDAKLPASSRWQMGHFFGRRFNSLSSALDSPSHSLPSQSVCGSIRYVRMSDPGSLGETEFALTALLDQEPQMGCCCQHKCFQPSGRQRDGAEMNGVVNRQPDLPMSGSLREQCTANLPWSAGVSALSSPEHSRRRYPSRVSGILTRFLAPANEVQPPSSSSQFQTEFRRSRGGTLCRSERSYGQAWTWLSERRRLASVGLNAALTYLSVPLHVILIELLYKREEPILNLTDS